MIHHIYFVVFLSNLFFPAHYYLYVPFFWYYGAKHLFFIDLSNKGNTVLHLIIQPSIFLFFNSYIFQLVYILAKRSNVIYLWNLEIDSKKKYVVFWRHLHYLSFVLNLIKIKSWMVYMYKQISRKKCIWNHVNIYFYNCMRTGLTLAGKIIWLILIGTIKYSGEIWNLI